MNDEYVLNCNYDFCSDINYDCDKCKEVRYENISRKNKGIER